MVERSIVHGKSTPVLRHSCSSLLGIFDLTRHWKFESQPNKTQTSVVPANHFRHDKQRCGPVRAQICPYEYSLHFDRFVPSLTRQTVHAQTELSHFVGWVRGAGTPAAKSYIMSFHFHGSGGGGADQILDPALTTQNKSPTVNPADQVEFNKWESLGLRSSNWERMWEINCLFLRRCLGVLQWQWQPKWRQSAGNCDHQETTNGKQCRSWKGFSQTSQIRKAATKQCQLVRCPEAIRAQWKAEGSVEGLWFQIRGTYCSRVRISLLRIVKVQICHHVF